jgi:hypothetical protein
MSFYYKKQFFDLKNISHISHTSATMQKDVAYEYRQDLFCSVDRFYSILRVSAMCRVLLSWQLQSKNLLLLGLIPVHALCTTDLLGKSQGYRGMPASSESQTLSHGDSWQNLPKHTCSHTNEIRVWRICANFAQVLIKTATKLYSGEDCGLEIDHTVYALDAAIIDLCLSVFSCAKFRRGKATVKLHTLLDLRGSIPVIVNITHGKIYDV